MSSELRRTSPSAVEGIYAEGKVLTPDQGGTASTRAFCDAVTARL